MAEITKLTADLDFIQKLDDEPNDVGGMTAQELKAEFDKSGNAIKTYVNETLIPAIEAGQGEVPGEIDTKVSAHNVSPASHQDIRDSIGTKIAEHNAAPTSHADIREAIAANASANAKTAADLSQHKADQNNPHGVTAAQAGADPSGTTTAADCFDEAASPTSAPNTWYVSKDLPRPSGEVGMMIDVRWKHGRTDGLGYAVSLVWGEPDGMENETIVDGANVSDGLTGEYSIPTEGTIRYQLIEQSGRKRWQYVSGKLLPKQFSSATAADVADKVVAPGMEIEYLPGMGIYVQMDKGNTADVMRLVPDIGPALPVYGNGTGAKTGDISAGTILHLVNAGDHWQIVNGGGSGNSGPAYVAQPEPPADTSKLWIDTDDDSGGSGGGAMIDDTTVAPDKVWSSRKVSDEFSKQSEQIVQSDWNENDPESKAFVKNRICYSEASKTAIIPLQDLTFLKGFSQFSYNQKIGEIGDTLVVSWNGVRYERELTYMLNPNLGFRNMLGIGNEGIVGGLDTGEPFFIAQDINGETGTAILLATTINAENISVSLSKLKVTPIPNKFAPKDWAENDPQNPAYIKNRFGGYDATYEQTLLESTEIVIESLGAGALVQNSIVPNVGDTVSLVIDDITYEGKVTFNPMLGLVIGNSSLVDVDPDTGEKYLAVWVPDGRMAFAFASDVYPVTKTVAIYKGTQGPVKIPEKYLPTPPDPLPPITPELDTAFLQAVDGQPTWVKLIDRSKVGG